MTQSTTKLKPGQLPSDWKNACVVPTRMAGFTAGLVSAPSLLRESTGVTTTESGDFVVLAPVAYDAKETAVSAACLKNSLLGVLRSRGGSLTSTGTDLRLRTKVSLNLTLSTNSVAAKYTAFIGGSGGYAIANVVNVGEWSSWDMIFDEAFIFSAKLEYRPFNKYSANTTANTGVATAAGQPGFINTLSGVIVGHQHNQGLYADGANMMGAMANHKSAKIVNLSDDWDYTWTNMERFDWKGPQGDATSTNATQTWAPVQTLGTLYGGKFQVGLPEPTGAAALIGTLFESAPFGTALITWDVAFRLRS